MALSKPMEMLANATSAAVGGFTATSLLYPLDTLKTRMQSTQDDPKPPLTLASLYQGYPYKVAESTVSKFFYFYAYTMLSQMVSSGKPINTATNLIVGYFAEFIHLPITLPMEVLATRLQTNSKFTVSSNSNTTNKMSIFDIISQVREENQGGFSGFYKGFRAYFVLCLQPAIQYTAFEQLKVLYLTKLKKKSFMSNSLSALEAFVLGAIARSIATLLLFPYIRAKVLVQSQKKKQKQVTTTGSNTIHTTTFSMDQLEKGQQKSEEGILATLQRVYQEEGYLALYRGLTPELTKVSLVYILIETTVYFLTYYLSIL
jgi:uncharacterized protein (DUF2062 family)